MAQSKGKYWLANNPSAEITNDEAAELDALLPAIPQPAQVDSVAASTSALKSDFNDLLALLRLAKIITP